MGIIVPMATGHILTTCCPEGPPMWPLASPLGTRPVPNPCPSAPLQSAAWLIVLSCSARQTWHHVHGAQTWQLSVPPKFLTVLMSPIFHLPRHIARSLISCEMSTRTRVPGQYTLLQTPFPTHFQTCFPVPPPTRHFFLRPAT